MIFQVRSSEGVVLPVEVFAPKTYTDQTGMSFSCFFLFKIFNLEGLECVFVFETIVILHPVLKVSKVLTVQVDIWIRFKPSYLCTRQQPSLHFVLVSPFVSNGSQAKPFIF